MERNDQFTKPLTSSALSARIPAERLVMAGRCLVCQDSHVAG
jgi:hypothetical protein